MSTRSLPDRFVIAFSTLLGIGNAPFWPGFWGSVPAVVAAYLWPGAMFWVLGPLTVLAYYCCEPSERLFKRKDPQVFVADEAVGMMITVLGFLPEIKLYLVGFVLFRILDTLKPWPIIRFQTLKHPSAILWDDVAAGVVAQLTLRLLTTFQIL